jgi:polyisoprenoid-binding protein YceI
VPEKRRITHRHVSAFWSLLVLLVALSGCGSPTQPFVAPASAGSALTESAPQASAKPSTATLQAAVAVPTGAARKTAHVPPTPKPTSQGLRTFRIVPSQTEASYEVQEQFFNRDLPTRVIGKTSAVEGEFQFNADAAPTGEVITMIVDLSTLSTGNPGRDQGLRRRWLETDTYPFAKFTSIDVHELPDRYTEGDEVAFKLIGNLTIHDVTHPVIFDVRGTLDGDTVTGSATTTLLMTDFRFQPPAIANVLTVENDVIVTIRFTAKEVAGND